MKTKTFIEKVEALGYEVDCILGTIYIKERSYTVISLEYVEEWDIDTDYQRFDEMRWADKKSLMRIVLEFLLTDPADREEEKRYRLRLDVPAMSSKQAWSVYYLNKHKEAKMYQLGSDAVSISWQTIFTASELAEMDITGFVKEEVYG